MEIHVPSLPELRQKFSNSRAAWILTTIGFLQFLVSTIRKLLDWKSSIEEAEVTAHQLSPLLGVAFSIGASPWFGLALVVLGLSYIVFVPSEDHPKSRFVASIAAWLAISASVAVLFFLAVFAVSMRLTGITPAQVSMPRTGNPYPERTLINMPAQFSSLAAGKQIGFNLYFMEPADGRVFNAVISGHVELVPVTNQGDLSVPDKNVRSEFERKDKHFRDEFYDGKLSGAEAGQGAGIWTTVLTSSLTQEQYQGLLNGNVRLYIVYWSGWTLTANPKSEKDSTEGCLRLVPLPSPENFKSELLAWNICS